MTNLTINSYQSKAIDFIRGFSALMIVFCHIFQGLEHELAWWFNVGVQIFFFMSGFLLAKEHITSPLIFIKKRMKKILIPYYILIFVTICFYKLLNIDISLKSIFTYLFCFQGITYSNIISGLEHLWFISVIILCYLLTILLNTLRCKIINHNFGYIFLILVLVLIQISVNYSILPTAFGARIGAFIIGYFLASRYQYNFNKELIINIFWLTLITLIIRIYFTYFYTIKSFNLNIFFDNYFVPWQHTLLGVFIFIFLYVVLLNKHTEKNVFIYFINHISKLSYEIYLTHHVLILGPLSLLHISKYLSLNLVIIFIFIWVYSLFVFKFSNLIKNIIKKL